MRSQEKPSCGGFFLGGLFPQVGRGESGTVSQQWEVVPVGKLLRRHLNSEPPPRQTPKGSSGTKSEAEQQAPFPPEKETPEKWRDFNFSNGPDFDFWLSEWAWAQGYKNQVVGGGKEAPFEI